MPNREHDRYRLGVAKIDRTFPLYNSEAHEDVDRQKVNLKSITKCG